MYDHHGNSVVLMAPNVPLANHNHSHVSEISKSVSDVTQTVTKFLRKTGKGYNDNKLISKCHHNHGASRLHSRSLDKTPRPAKIENIKPTLFLQSVNNVSMSLEKAEFL